jgi:uncharacterized repeat protein (TIGR03837 family)
MPPALSATATPTSSPATAPGATWDLWCRVIDNHGDLGVCWRLACTLAAQHGLQVRLFCDDPRALAWMAPAGAPGVQLLPWPEDGAAVPAAGSVVIEAFGCDPPAPVVAAMSARAQPPVWLNLEYLSAETYVERSHALPSPQPGGLTKWFFYPGFTPRTGGLLREAGLLAARDQFDGDAWLAARGWARRPGERVFSLFCYPQAPLAALLPQLAAQPTLLLATPGPAQQGLAQAGMAGAWPAGVRSIALPWLPQPDYDRLLWACDANFVRGEDSLVRGLWAGAPLVWQLYAQHDQAHAAKLQAWLDRLQPPASVRAFLWAWNGLAAATPLPPLHTLPAWPSGPDWAAWQAACQRWRAELRVQPPLDVQLLAFVAARSAT